MNNYEMKEALRDLMNHFDLYRAKWIEMTGTENGFNEWFTQEVFQATADEPINQLVRDHEGI